jgi:hypothetical protein
MKSIGATLLSFTLFAVSGSSAYACSCANPSQREKFRKADCVFLGEVIGITDSNVEGFIWAAKFKVEKLWKGPKIPEPIVNFTFDTPGWCGDLSLAKGKRFLIYAYRQKEDLVSYTDCGPNLQAKYATSSVKKLDHRWYRLFARACPF